MCQPVTSPIGVFVNDWDLLSSDFLPPEPLKAALINKLGKELLSVTPPQLCLTSYQ